MKNKIRFSDLRQLLLDMGFREKNTESAVVFQHVPSDTIFVFRLYRGSDPVLEHNVMEVRSMLDARGMLSPEGFERRFDRKKPA